MPEVDLVVVNHNTSDKIERMIRTVNEDDNGLWTLNVVDNGSTDGSVEVIRGLFRDKKIRFNNFWTNVNIGYAKACNEMADRGDSPIIGLLNGDVWLTSYDVAKIVQSFEKHPEAAIIGPKQRDEKGYITHAGIIGDNENPRHRGWKAHDQNDSMFQDIVECVTVAGSAYFIRREVWDELTSCSIFTTMNPGTVGAFLPTPHYYEETWCSYHARAHGHKILYDGTISIGHSWHASSAIGGEADQHFKTSQRMFRMMCDAHSIPRD